MKFKKFWIAFFLMKVFYLFFAFFIYARLTKLGDTGDYLGSGINFAPSVLYSSTSLMFFLGGLFKKIFVLDVLASIPAMLLSFYGVYYAVDRLNLYKYPILLFIALNLPNFGVWTSIHSKEAFGCFFSGILAVMIVKFLNKDFRIKLIYLVALYLCLIFKPHYFLFIIQVLVFLRLSSFFRLGPTLSLMFGVFIILINLTGLYVFRDFIDNLAQGLYIHFTSSDPDVGKSTRSADPWLQRYGFFKQAPYGMFIAFWGPTFSEMLSKPTHLISGLESILLTGMLIYLSYKRFAYITFTGFFNPKLLITLFIIVVGILFVHYPFGFLNPGSAIRYRENFYLLFLILMFYSFSFNEVNRYLRMEKNAAQKRR